MPLKASRIYSGIALGISYAYFFYAFTYILRESFRYICLSTDFEFWILNPEERSYYNFILALFASIFGLNTCLIYIFNRPLPTQPRRLLNHHRIFNNQTLLSGYFLSWMSKILLVYFIFFGLILSVGNYRVSIYPDYKLLFYYIAIVLFLQSWLQLVRVYKMKGQKAMLFSGIILVMNAWICSKWEIIDYRKIDEICLSQNSTKFNRVNLPEADPTVFLNKEMMVEELIVYENPDSTIPLTIIYEGKSIAMDDIDSVVINARLKRMDSDIRKFTYRICADRTTKMKHLKKLENTLLKSGKASLTYGVIPEKRTFKKSYYTNCAVNFPDDKWKSDSLSVLWPGKQMGNPINTIHIEIGAESFGINGNKYDKSTFYAKLTNEIKEDPHQILLLKTEEECRLSEYIYFLSRLNSDYQFIRNEHSLYYMATEFEICSPEEQDYIKRIFPIKLIEVE